MKRVLSLSMLVIVLAGCAGHRAESYVDSYHDARQRFPGAAVDETSLTRFRALWSALQDQDLAQRVDAVYAEELYFNDTLHSFDSRVALRRYLLATAARVDTIELQIERMIVDGTDVWVQWYMATDIAMPGRDMRARTIGMTHLRFNEQGQVVLHQDYWDSAEGVFIHIPLIGGLVRWTRNRL